MSLSRISLLRRVCTKLSCTQPVLAEARLALETHSRPLAVEQHRRISALIALLLIAASCAPPATLSCRRCRWRAMAPLQARTACAATRDTPAQRAATAC
jgi:hypothetical protein